MRLLTSDSKFIIIYAITKNITDNTISTGESLTITTIYSNAIDENDQIDFYINKFETLVITDSEDIKWYYSYSNKQFKRVV